MEKASLDSRHAGELLTPLARYGRTAVIMAAITGAGLLLRASLNPTDLAMLVLLGIVVVAARYGRGPAVAASLFGILAYDFLFVPPYYTLDVTDKSYFLTFGVMLVVALTLTGLTARIREQAEEALLRAERSEALMALSDEFGGGVDRGTILEIAARHIGRSGGGSATIVLTDELELDHGIPRWPEVPALQDISTRVAAGWSWQNREAAGSGTSHGADADGLVVPLRSSSRVLGIVVLRPEPSDRRVTDAERATAQLLADQTALALELAAHRAEVEDRV